MTSFDQQTSNKSTGRFKFKQDYEKNNNFNGLQEGDVKNISFQNINNNSWCAEPDKDNFFSNISNQDACGKI